MPLMTQNGNMYAKMYFVSLIFGEILKNINFTGFIIDGNKWRYFLC